MSEHVLPSDMGYDCGPPAAGAAADRMKNKMRSVARQEFSEMVPLCAMCDAELDDYESCYCDACEASID